MNIQMKQQHLKRKLARFLSGPQYCDISYFSTNGISNAVDRKQACAALFVNLCMVFESGVDVHRHPSE